MIARQRNLFAPLRGLALAAASTIFAACAPLPPSPADVAAKRFEPVDGQSVIYLVRDRIDSTEEQTTIMLDDRMMGTTYRGTYFRWVVEPGRHRIAGFAGDSGAMTIDARAGGIHYVQQSTFRSLGWVQSHFYPVPENAGRALVRRAELIASP